MLENPIFMGGIALLIFGLQLLLCFRVRHLLLRLIPGLLFVLLAVFFVILILTTEGWGVLLYLVLLILTGYAIALDALAWLVWLIVQGVRRRKTKPDENQ